MQQVIEQRKKQHKVPAWLAPQVSSIDTAKLDFSQVPGRSTFDDVGVHVENDGPPGPYSALHTQPESEEDFTTMYQRAFAAAAVRPGLAHAVPATYYPRRPHTAPKRAPRAVEAMVRSLHLGGSVTGRTVNKKPTANPAEGNLTFKPEINKRSAKLASVRQQDDEANRHMWLHQNAMKQKEARDEAARRQQEQNLAAELAECSFSPTLSKRTQRMRVRAAGGFEAFYDHAVSWNSCKDQKLHEARQLKSAAEVTECTFRPNTRDSHRTLHMNSYLAPASGCCGQSGIVPGDAVTFASEGTYLVRVTPSGSKATRARTESPGARAHSIPSPAGTSALSPPASSAMGTTRVMGHTALHPTATGVPLDDTSSPDRNATKARSWVVRSPKQNNHNAHMPPGVLTFGNANRDSLSESQLRFYERMAVARERQVEMKYALAKYDGSGWSPGTTVPQPPALGGTEPNRIGSVPSLRSPVAFAPGAVS